MHEIAPSLGPDVLVRKRNDPPANHTRIHTGQIVKSFPRIKPVKLAKSLSLAIQEELPKWNSPQNECW